MLVEVGKVYIIITFLCKHQLSSDVTFTTEHLELLNNFPDNKPVQSIHIRCWIIQSSRSVPTLLGQHRLKFLLGLQGRSTKAGCHAYIVHILAFQDKRFDLYVKAEDW